MPPLKLYSDRSHYLPAHRGDLCTFLRPFWKNEPFADAQRQAMYGLTSADYVVIDRLVDADAVVLPMSWNYYVHHGLIPQAETLIHQARQAGKPIIAWTGGDFGVTLPHDDIHVLRCGGYRSKQKPREYALPVFFNDPMAKFSGQPPTPDGPEPKSGTDTNTSPTLPSKPVVGFCGYASDSRLKLAIHFLRTFKENLGHRLGWRPEDPQTLYPAVRLRQQALNVLRHSPRVTANFILRDRSRTRTDAPTKTHQEREFYQNIRDSDYILCLRGSGNFSKRFYETLAMGRIPLFVDTDCLLPFPDQLPWDDLMCRVTPAEIPRIDQMMAQHYARLADPDCRSRHFTRLRTTWQEWLTFGGFHNHFLSQLFYR